MKTYMSSLTFFFLMHYYCLGGGHVITPTKYGKTSIVKHMLAIDWKLWKPYMKKGASVSMTICFLERIAGILLCTNKNRPFYGAHFNDVLLSSFMLQH